MLWHIEGRMTTRDSRAWEIVRNGPTWGLRQAGEPRERLRWHGRPIADPTAGLPDDLMDFVSDEAMKDCGRYWTIVARVRSALSEAPALLADLSRATGARPTADETARAIVTAAASALP